MTGSELKTIVASAVASAVAELMKHEHDDATVRAAARVTRKVSQSAPRFDLFRVPRPGDLFK